MMEMRMIEVGRVIGPVGGRSEFGRDDVHRLVLLSLGRGCSMSTCHFLGPLEKHRCVAGGITVKMDGWPALRMYARVL